MSGDDSTVMDFAVSATNDGIVVAWAEYIADEPQLSFAFAHLRLDGQVLLERKRLTALAPYVDVSAMGVAMTSNSYLIMYTLSDTYQVIELDRTGALVDARAPGGNFRNARFFSADGRPAVVFRSSTAGYYRIFLQRLTAYGDLDGSAQSVAAATVDMYEPAGVWTGSGYLVVWHDSQTGGRRIRGATFDTDGANPSATSTILNTGNSQDTARISRGVGGSYFVSWLEGDAGFGVNVDASGYTPLTSAAPLFEANRRESMNYDVAGDENRVGIVWESDHGQVATQIHFRLGPEVAPFPSSLTETRANYYGPAIASAPGVFATATVSPVDGARRLFLLLVDQ